MFKNSNRAIGSTATLVPAKSEGFDFKAGKLYRAVFVDVFKKELVDDADMKLFLSLSSSKIFKTGGYELLRKDVGNDETLKSSNGMIRYYKDIQLSYGRSKYYLTSQLYVKSIPPLLQWLSSKGLDTNAVKKIYDNAYLN